MTYEEMTQNAAEATQFLKLLSNEHRLTILCLLHNGELSVSALNEKVALSQSALSQHLAVLRKEGVVETRRDSQTIFYSIADPRISSIIQSLHAIFCSE